MPETHPEPRPSTHRGAPHGIDRRTLLRTAAAAGAAGALGGLADSPAAAAPRRAAAGVLPEYTFVREALDTADLAYNPTGEFIFPCLRGTEGRLPDAPGRFLLYYAPHDAPGGICLAYADTPEGPYTEHPGNPIVGREWAPHYSVSHVSSPHVLWNEQEREMWLYFHGENTTTRLARSRDGADFSYEGEVLTTAMLPEGTTETSYARVFEHPLPDRGSRYVMVFMRNDTTDHRSIGWGWSADGVSFDFDPDPLVDHAAAGAANLSGPHVVERGGSTYVAYHTSEGDIRLTEVGRDFSLRRHLGTVHEPMAGPPDNGRSAAPSYGSHHGTQYMLYEAGSRLGATIAVARA
ncbi:glycoside hydrolase family protein [Streptomonospora wellingtoniae]|uniref:Twin-arginine translocation signal domain-containing protein n=1 Tax=Streptomonospora wellingtoniae TaxID=3075544 RepID=A0ABU2KRK1_9ACTN|nr:twin-arginine translocation signal domain-containing protein [Streptomonospora sp. DSM 45055]MDT0301921.1 twin-arginine translocation signal domain-containing protein [Streptomonospora sp. DSM 45055]